jgi:hypothetical protein
VPQRWNGYRRQLNVIELETRCDQPDHELARSLQQSSH